MLSKKKYNKTGESMKNKEKKLRFIAYIRRSEERAERWPHLFGQKSLVLKWDLADDGFCPFSYAALCMAGMSLK